MELFADALPALAGGFAQILQPERMMFLALGVVLGLSVGVFPGLGGIAGLSLLLPFIYGMDPVSGLALMIGLIAVIPTSDTFASVLMGIPGSSSSQATVLDGFPLARQGQAARALSAAFASSLFGGLFGAIVLTFFILIARPLVLAFGFPELLAITLLGLSMVAIMAGRAPLKGLVAAGLGLLVGTIGEAEAGGSLRMSTYDMPYLTDGLQLVIVGLAIFAVPEIVALLRQDTSIARDAKLGAGWLDGVRDWWANKWLSIRCAVIGVIVGVIPGLGGSVVDWIAYGHSVQSTKDKSKFGSGEIRGVVGPESSNNAKEGGGLVPTLIFGIPGSGSMAVFIGALALLGYEAGPRMVTDELELTYTIVWSLALANVLGAGLCILLAGGIAKLTTIRFALLAPFMFMLISFAAFQSRQSLGDLIALFAIGVLGIFMRRFDWSRPAFLIGFVLADQTESYSFQAFQVASFRFRRGLEEGLEYIFTPIVIGIVVLTVVSVVVGLRQAKTIYAEGRSQSGGKTAPMIFLALVTAYIAVALYDALGIRQTTDMVFPAFVASVSLIGCLGLLLQMLLEPRDAPIFADREVAGEDAEAPNGLWGTLGWLALLLVLSSLVGFMIALIVFLPIFLRFRAACSWFQTILLSAAGVGFMLFMAASLNRSFPQGLLQETYRLPWPFN